MMRQCVHEDEFIGDGDKRCGKTFDDVKCSTICPHEALPTPDEIQAFFEQVSELDNEKDKKK